MFILVFFYDFLVFFLRFFWCFIDFCSFFIFIVKELVQVILISYNGYNVIVTTLIGVGRGGQGVYIYKPCGGALETMPLPSINFFKTRKKKKMSATKSFNSRFGTLNNFISEEKLKMWSPFSICVLFRFQIK